MKYCRYYICLVVICLGNLAYSQISVSEVLDFKNIGPSIMSGRVVDLDVNPDNPIEFYVAYASGGLWYTHNNGTTFTPVMDEIPENIMGDIAVDWSSGTIYVGKGENNASRSSYAGNGVWKSSDKGKTWEQVITDIQRTGRIVIDSSNPNQVWVASAGNLYSKDENRGIYHSADAGKTWDQTLFISDSTGMMDIVQDPLDPATLYAASWERQRYAWNFKGNGKESAIYKSTDSGKNWTLVTTGSNGFPHDEGVGRIGLTASVMDGKKVLYAVVDNQNIKPDSEPQKSDDTELQPENFEKMTQSQFEKISDKDLDSYLRSNRFPRKYTAEKVKSLIQSGKNKVSDLYEYTHNANAALFNTDIKGAEVYVSKDGGDSWQKTHTGYLDNVYFTYGYYFGQIRSNPSDPNEIYIYGVPFLKSLDGGKTWDYIFADNLHVDHHALWVNPKQKDHLILGNDGGVYITYDGGKTWIPCNVPAVGQFYDIHYDKQEPYHVYGGLQDNGVWEGPSNSSDGQGWKYYGHNDYKNIMGGDGMQVQVVYDDPETTITGFQFGNYFRVNSYTKDFQRITPQHDLGENPFRWNWQSPILLSEHHNEVLYMGSHRFHRSLDRGDSWQTLSEDLTTGGKVGNVPYGTITCIVESPETFGKLYIGTDDGKVHRSADGGYTWKDITSNLPKGYWVSRIALSTEDESRIFCTLNNYRNDDFSTYVYRSDDDGKTWKSLDLDTHGAANVILEDPEHPSFVYLGTDYGLFLSNDGGDSFVDVSEKVDYAPVHDLFIHPVTHDLVIGTHGRSIYKASTKQLYEMADAMKSNLYVFSLEDDFLERERNYNPAKNDTNTIRFSVYSKKAGQAEMKLYKGDKVIYSLNGPLRAGMNTIEWKITDEIKDLERRSGHYKVVVKQSGQEASREKEL